jgi:capsid portal protein
MEDNNYIQEAIKLADSTFMDSSFVVPKIQIQHGKDYVPWGDKGKNDYPEKLVALLDNSALHNAIIVNKSWQVAGNGFTFDEQGEKGKATAEFLEEINSKDEDANEVLGKAAFDFQIFGGLALLVTWSKDWKRITEVEHVEFNKVRAAKPNEFGEIEGYYYSFDWSVYRPNKIFIPRFNSKIAEEGKKAYEKAIQAFKEGNESVEDQRILKDKERTQILYMKPYRPNTFYYPLPSYAGAITSIEADIESDQFGLASLKNGMDINYIVKFFKKGTKEERFETVKGFYDSYTSSRNAGKPMIIFAKDKDEAPQVEKLESPDLNKRYLAVNDNSLQKILSGHRVTPPILVGIMIPGKLGGSSDIKEAQELFYNTVIQPDQLFITKAFNKIMKVNDLEVLSIEKNSPFTDEEIDELEEQAEGQEDGNNNEIVDTENIQA